jgi:anti-anti-sigma regulatory factor
MLSMMKLLFSMKNHIQVFGVEGEIQHHDAEVLRSALFTFLESQPPFVILDLSQATLMVPDSEIQKILTEVRTLAQSRNIQLSIAQTDLESLRAPKQVLESALEQRAKILEAKLELRQSIQDQTAKLKTENETLRSQLKRPSPLSPFSVFEKLWNSK